MKILDIKKTEGTLFFFSSKIHIYITYRNFELGPSTVRPIFTHGEVPVKSRHISNLRVHFNFNRSSLESVSIEIK